jgi:hypothetical protein
LIFLSITLKFILSLVSRGVGLFKVILYSNGCAAEIAIFGGAMYPSNSLHLGVQRKLTAFSPCKVVHHAVFCKYYAELANTHIIFFGLTIIKLKLDFNDKINILFLFSNM